MDLPRNMHLLEIAAAGLNFPRLEDLIEVPGR